MRRAGTGNENSTAPKRLDRGTSEPVIRVKRTGAVRLALGERRRVKDDQIKLALFILTQPFKSVGLDHFTPAGVDRRSSSVQRKIPSHRGQGVTADIKIGHRAGPTARRVHRKSPREAERIKRFASSCQGSWRERASGSVGTVDRTATPVAMGPSSSSTNISTSIANFGRSLGRNLTSHWGVTGHLTPSRRSFREGHDHGVCSGHMTD